MIFLFMLPAIAGLVINFFNKVIGGVFKTASIYAISAYAILQPTSVLLKMVFVGFCVAETMLSVVYPYTKKFLFFAIGLGIFLLSYLGFGINFITIPNDLAKGLFLFSLACCFLTAGVIQVKHLDKADIVLKTVLSVFLASLSFMVFSLFTYNPLMGISAIGIYTCDTVIGHSSYNSKYKIPEILTESLITICFTLGLLLIVYFM